MREGHTFDLRELLGRKNEDVAPKFQIRAQGF
jgi:hypothetical protein